jgi:hypothetical protein
VKAYFELKASCFVVFTFIECLFVGRVLHEKEEGGPFNKLILQTEGKEAWETDDEDEKEVLGIDFDVDRSERSNDSDGKDYSRQEGMDIMKGAASAAAEKMEDDTASGGGGGGSGHKAEYSEAKGEKKGSDKGSGSGSGSGSRLRSIEACEVLYRRDLERLQSELEESCRATSFCNAIRRVLQGVSPRFPKYAPQLTPSEPLENVADVVGAGINAAKIHSLMSGGYDFRVSEAKRLAELDIARAFEIAAAAGADVKAIQDERDAYEHGRATSISRVFLDSLAQAMAERQAKGK